MRVDAVLLVIQDRTDSKKFFGIVVIRKIITGVKNYNGSKLKNPDVSGALYTLRIQYSYTQTQCEDGARDVRVL